MTLPIRIANNIDFGKSWTYNLCALYSRYLFIISFKYWQVLTLNKTELSLVWSSKKFFLGIIIYLQHTKKDFTSTLNS